MTWFPLQAAIKMSTLAGAIRHTLDTLLDHINPAKDPVTGQTDPTRPQTLIAFESLDQLAADTGFSMVSVADHLKRLRGDKPLRPGLWLAVLERVAAATHHRAARYRLNPEALDRLADRERVKAFEQGEPKPTHPYHLWRDWRKTAAPPDAGNQPMTSQGISSLHPDTGQGISSLHPRVQAAYSELTNVVVDPLHQLTTFSPDQNHHPTLSQPLKKKWPRINRRRRRPEPRRPTPWN